jgi:tetratricopeptide (TPR) repeat protein
MPLRAQTLARTPISARTGILVGLFIGVGALLLIGRSYSRGANDGPFVPQHDSDVVETLPTSSDGIRARRLAAMRRRLEANPNNLELATLLAGLNIEESREQSDPRFLGYAQAALAPWWREPNPPTEVLLLRATIRQSSHDFDGALVDLDALLKANPSDIQGWLTRSVILTVQSKYAEAKASCDQVASLARGLISEVCFANLDSLQGRAKAAYQRLSGALEEERASGGISVQTWVLSSLGEIAVRAGEDTQAELHFRQALGLEPSDPYVLGAYADLLLDLHRPKELIALLKQYAQNDGLLLRLALAEAQLRMPSYREHVETLRKRFDAGRERGDSVHRREESRFELALGKNPKLALDLAKENWKVQREPWDARVLLEAAKGARDRAAAEPVLAAMATSHFEEPRLAELARQVRELN